MVRKGRVSIRNPRRGFYEISIAGNVVEAAFSKKEALMKANRIRKLQGK